ncbi:hypothetical protein H5410_029925 [Solanum commersonii]|uniref:Uncharacterized protein n=1 Tax=Solanum commersonii TaxID=4109 RepID=A0A9J5YCU8_SOLCO|nr:hypothetical protein H5410_029925 [Solanum commersonii]
MSITESSSRTSISQEVENPSSFNFSVHPLEESPSTPVCGAGEMDESISSLVDILVSHVLHSGNTLVCSPTLVLSKLVAVQSLASLRGDLQPTSLEYELESPDQVPPRSEPIFDRTPKSFDVGSDKEEEEEIPLKWRSRGMRGTNQSQVNVSELEAVKGTSEVDIVEKSVEREKEKQRKRKGKLSGMANLVDVVIIQGWNHLFEPPVPYLHEPEVHEFFYKMELLEGSGITTTVRNMEIHLDEETRGIIL